MPANRWPPEVGALPHLVGQRTGQRGDDRPTAHGAARVAGAVRADEHHRLGVLVARAEPGPERVGGVEEVLGGAPRAAHPRAPDGVDGVPRRGSSSSPRRPGRRTRSTRPPKERADLLDLCAERTEQRWGLERLLGPGPRVLDEQPPGGDGGGAGLRVTAGAGTRRSSARDRSGPPRDATRGRHPTAGKRPSTGGQARPWAARLRRLTLSMMTARRRTAPVTMNLTLDSTLSRSSPFEIDWMTRMPSSAE